MTKTNHLNFMQLAIKKTRQGIAKGQTPFGACIIKDEKIISCEHNVVWKTTDITAHAEVHAIRQACKKLKSINLKGCILYSTCEPCPMCFAAIHWANISKVYFGAKIQDAKKAGFHELFISNQRMKSLGKSPVNSNGGMLRKECAELFDLWKQTNKSSAY